MKDNENKIIVKIICGIIVVGMIAGNFYLTFQSPKQTTALSESVRLWLSTHGWEMTPKQIRSNAHIPVFFLLGMAFFIFGRAMQWKWFVSFILASFLALLDEGIKMILPTREFDFVDLSKDFVGIGVAFFIALTICSSRIICKKSNK